MTKRIFRSICIVALAVAISCVMLATGGLYSYFTMQQQNHLKTLTELTYEAVEKCDYIVLTHGHYDHITDIPALVKNSTPAFCVAKARLCP